jgi:hypothetical protein
MDKINVCGKVMDHALVRHTLLMFPEGITQTKYMTLQWDGCLSADGGHMAATSFAVSIERFSSKRGVWKRGPLLARACQAFFFLV